MCPLTSFQGKRKIKAKDSCRMAIWKHKLEEIVLGQLPIMLTWPIIPSRKLIYMVPLFVRNSGSRERLVEEVISWDIIRTTRPSKKKTAKLVSQGSISKSCLKIGLSANAPSVKNILRSLRSIGDTKSGCRHLVEDAWARNPGLITRRKSSCSRTFLQGLHITRAADSYPRRGSLLSWTWTRPFT